MWEKEMRVGLAAAVAAGDVLNTMFGKPILINKKGVIDLVTEADIRAEQAIVEIIREAFGDDGIITEESEAVNPDAARVWIVDPLDGTTNYAHRFPFFAVSIALKSDDRVVCGIVFNPRTREMFTATFGGGAFLNERPIHVSDTATLEDSLLATGFPYDIRVNPEPAFSIFKRVTMAAGGIRRPGAAALDLCHVAAGWLDGFWEQGLKPWDVAAGSLMVTEAGGGITDYSGAAHTLDNPGIVAATPGIQAELLIFLEEGRPRS